ATHLRVIDVHHRPGPALEKPAEVRAEIDGDAVRERPVPMHAHAKCITDTTTRAIRRDQVPRTHMARLPCIAIADQRLDAAGILFKRDALGRKLDAGAELLRCFPERRLERVLREKHTYRRTEVAYPLVEVRDVMRCRTAH